MVSDHGLTLECTPYCVFVLGYDIHFDSCVILFYMLIIYPLNILLISYPLCNHIYILITKWLPCNVLYWQCPSFSAQDPSRCMWPQCALVSCLCGHEHSCDDVHYLVSIPGIRVVCVGTCTLSGYTWCTSAVLMILYCNIYVFGLKIKDDPGFLCAARMLATHRLPEESWLEPPVWDGLPVYKLVILSE